MNYIELINRFWLLNKEHAFTAHQVQLYFKLLDTCNQLGWKNPFQQANRYLCAEMGVSEPTFIRVRNRLAECGLITFESGKKGVTTRYHITQALKSFSHNSSVAAPKSLDNNKHKQNETKQSVSSFAKAGTFVPPTTDEVEQFFLKRKKLTFSEAKHLTERFFDYYTSVGWQVGRLPMKNWQGAASRAVTWLADSNKTGGNLSPKKLHASTNHNNEKGYEKF